MTGSWFEEIDTNGLTIQGGDWSYANLRFLDLRGQNFTDCRLVEADFMQCDLRKAVFHNADLTKSVLSHAKLRGADFRGATMDAIDFKNMEVEGVRLDIAHTVALARAYGALVD